MVLGTPYGAAENTALLNRSISLDLDWLAEVIRAANRPVTIQELAREAVRAIIVADGQLRVYVPGCSYNRGERLRLLDGRLGDIIQVAPGENREQGSFSIATVRMADGEHVHLACDVPGAPEVAVPELVTDATVDMLLLGQEHEVIRHVRQALAADPRFITLYYGDGEYGCLREFFPPMSPDVLDAALALLLDALFDQEPLSRITALPSDFEVESEVRGSPPESLFSTSRLDSALTAEAEWQDPTHQVFEKIRSLWLRAEEHGGEWDSMQLARVYLQPLLRVLGWSVVPLPPSTALAEGTYALCADDFSASELYLGQGERATPASWALALLRGEGWGQPLDQLPSATRAELNDTAWDDPPVNPTAPAHSLVGSLRRAEVRWGILTNGRVWRLICRDANSLARAYYEVDLGDVFADLASGEAPDREHWEVFRRWWLLFRQASYVRNGDGRCVLEHLREREPRAEQHMRNLLRERLLTRALPAVAGGFVAYRKARSGVKEETPAGLQEIHHASVFLLIRLLFVLVAEGRGHLPLKDSDYRPHSLTAQAEWAADRVRRNLPLSDGMYTTARYDIVLALFHRIARGDADKNLPTYGRVFFNPGENDAHRFLETVRLSDRLLAQALDALFRGIDYAALDARDVISVCCALLGSQITVVDAEAGVVAITRLGDERVRAEVWPDFVVTSAVEQALGPALQARDALFEDAMDQVVAVRRRLRRTLDRRRRSALHVEWEAATRRARNAFLGIRVCDPAMGVGDFLMSCVDVMTDGIIEHLQAYHHDHPDVPRDWNPIYHLFDQVSQDITEELDRQGLAHGQPAITDTSILSRLVAQRTLFGVANDPLAVELAQVGLWLHTFTVGAPLCFFDHHLRFGNGLLGTDFAVLSETCGLTPAPVDMLEAAEGLYALTERVDSTPLDVQWSSAQFARSREALAPLRRLLDMVVSAGLGTADATAALEALDAENWRGELARVLPPWVETQAEAEGFFHWALEFPEAFIDLAEGDWQEAPGFDVVLGSPPYVVTSDEALAAFYESRFRRDDVYNAHHAYLALARMLARRPGGRTAYVLCREWLAKPTGGI